jgi:hypothetical protein
MMKVPRDCLSRNLLVCLLCVFVLLGFSAICFACCDDDDDDDVDGDDRESAFYLFFKLKIFIKALLSASMIH